MSLEALLFQVLCILTVFAFVMARIEGKKKPTQRSSAEQAVRNTQSQR